MDKNVFQANFANAAFALADVLKQDSDFAESILKDVDFFYNVEQHSSIANSGLSRGVHLIIGMPQSGKTTLLRSIATDMAIVDEPIAEGDDDFVVYYGPDGIATSLEDIISSERAKVAAGQTSGRIYAIDSLRLVINSLGGPLQSNGISVNYKLLLTELNNLARLLNIRLVVIATTDSDILREIRGSVSSLTVVARFKYVTQRRGTISPEARSIFGPSKLSYVRLDEPLDSYSAVLSSLGETVKSQGNWRYTRPEPHEWNIKNYQEIFNEDTDENESNEED